jgi:DNA invertase Pin-like site-specific DNA recombinase
MSPQQAGIYARISKDRTGQALGVERQIEDCQALALSKGWGVAGTYIDNDVSASTRSKAPRPEYDRLLADAEAGRLDGIIVYNMDRLTRRVFEMAKFLSWREERSIPFMTTEGDDTESASGRMIINIKAAVAQQEAERISERVERALSQRRENGGASSGGHPAFGWDDGSYRVINLAQARAVREGAQMILDGATVGDVLRDWGSRDIGAPTSRTAVRRVLTNPRTAGILTYKGQEIGRGDMVPLIDEDTFRALQKVLRGYSKRGRPPKVHLLAGLVVCGLCDSKMAAQVTKDRARWACDAGRGGCNKVSRDYRWLNDTVDQVVLAALQRVPEASMELVGPDLGAEIARLEDLATRTREQVLSGALGAEGLELMSDIRHKLLTLRAEQGALTRQESPELAQVWLEGSFESRRSVAEALIERILVLPIGKGGYGAVKPLPFDSIRVILR